MPELVKTDKSAHWYDRNGTPQHQVPYAKSNKAKAGKMKNTTLRDARKLDLVPSVTTILKCIYKPQLERWKIEQGMLAALPAGISYALMTPRRKWERKKKFFKRLLKMLPRDDDFVRRLREDAVEVSRKAAGKGTASHKAIERWLADHEDQPAEIDGFEVDMQRKTFIRWWDEHSFDYHRSEKTFVANGMGGTIDLLAIELSGNRFIVDIKTQATEEGKPFGIYRDWGYQLAAYDRGVHPPADHLLNVVISTTEPGRYEVKDWADERDELYGVFEAAFTIWRDQNNYDPRIKKGCE